MFVVMLILFLLFGGALTLLAVQNLSVPMHLTFYTWQTPELPTGLWIVAAFLLGALVLYLISVLSAWDDHREIRRLRKHVQDLEQRAGMAGAHTPAPMRMAAEAQVTAPLIPQSGVKSGKLTLLPLGE